MRSSAWLLIPGALAVLLVSCGDPPPTATREAAVPAFLAPLGLLLKRRVFSPRFTTAPGGAWL